MQKKVVACIIARTVSTRLPLKIFRKIDSQYRMLDFIIERLKLVNEIDKIYLCTSSEVADDIMEDIVAEHNIGLYRGSANQVIERMIEVGKIENADYLIRVTGDNVFSSYEYLPYQIQKIKEDSLEYVRLDSVPIGAACEVISFEALQHCYENMDPEVSEYLMLFIFNPKQYKCGIVKLKNKDYSNNTLTVDVPVDLERTKQVLSNYKGEPINIKLSEIMSIIAEHNLPNAIYEAGADVKLPYGKIVSFSDFQSDMQGRKEASKKYEIDEI